MSKMKCPKCKSVRICLLDDAPGGTKTSLNLNPLKPFTIVNTKKKSKKVVSKGKIAGALMTGGASLLVTGARKKVSEEWFCMECGNRWYEK